jgi:hypothetical protein
MIAMIPVFFRMGIFKNEIYLARVCLIAHGLMEIKRGKVSLPLRDIIVSTCDTSRDAE